MARGYVGLIITQASRTLHNAIFFCDGGNRRSRHNEQPCAARPVALILLEKEQIQVNMFIRYLHACGFLCNCSTPPVRHSWCSQSGTTFYQQVKPS